MQESRAEDVERTSTVKSHDKVTKNQNKNKSLLMECSKNINSKLSSNKKKNMEKISPALEDSNNSSNEESEISSRKRKRTTSESTLKEKKVRNKSDSESVSGDESKLEDEISDDEEEEEEQQEYWEDIYGRRRDKSGNIVEVIIISVNFIEYLNWVLASKLFYGVDI